MFYFETLAHYALPFAAIIGAIVGSCITLLTYRLPLEQPVALKGSRCPKCQARLGILDLLPLISWVVLRGRCRHCRAAIPVRYPLIELACAATAMLSVSYFGFNVHALVVAALGWVVISIMVTDFEHYIILDEAQIALALLAVAHAYLQAIPWSAVVIAGASGVALGLALKYGFLWIAKKDGLGLGDVKFLGAAGCWLTSIEQFVPFLFFSGVLGVVLGLVWRKLGRGERFPFGPALATALLACVVWPAAAGYFWKLYSVGY